MIRNTVKEPSSRSGSRRTVPRQAMHAEALLKVLWEGIDAGLALYDASGQRLMTSAAAVRMLGIRTGSDGDDLDSSRFAGRVVYVADGMTICPEAEWPMRRALQGEVVRSQELLVCDDDHPDGQRMMVSAYPMQLLDGSMGALVAFRDVTKAGRTSRPTAPASMS